MCTSSGIGTLGRHIFDVWSFPYQKEQDFNTKLIGYKNPTLSMNYSIIKNNPKTISNIFTKMILFGQI